MQSNSDSAARIRAAEKRVKKARKALEKAESGLKTAERVADKVGTQSHPVMRAVVLASLLGLFGFVVLALKGSD